MKQNVGLILAKRAHLTPRLEGYVDVATDRHLTYAELDAGCNRAAHMLAAKGIGKGDRVALLMLNCPEFVEAYFALAKIGAVVVPLNIRLVADELTFIIKDSGATLMIYGEEFAETVADIQGRGPAATDIADWIFVAAPDSDGGARADFADDYAALVAGQPDAEPEIAAEEDDILYIMYTSGTTGLPKGVVHTHKTATWACISIASTVDLRFKDRYLLMLPMYHVGALTPVTGNVFMGVTSVVMRTFDPAGAWQVIEDQRIDVSLAVPAMLNFMQQVPDTGSINHDRLRWIMSGAAPVPVSMVKAYAERGIEIHEVYGLTECCGPACVISPDDAMSHIGSTGKAFFYNDIRIGLDDGSEAPRGTPGEVLVRAKHVMTEYWNNPEATAQTVRDGWLHTGDVAVMDEDGFVYIKDRLKDMIISGGENIYPAEIENVILAHPNVREVAVIGQPSARWGESPIAVVVANGAETTTEDIIGHCIGKLAPYKLPKGVEFIDVIPRNPTGKVLKKDLRERFPGPAPE